MKIDYVCQGSSEVVDGRVIYDARLLDGLRSLGHDARRINVTLRPTPSMHWPLWQRKIDRYDKDRLREGAKLIVSHELLIPIVKILKPDLFIIHNFFPTFVWPEGSVYEAYCRLGSAMYYKNGLSEAENVVFLSKREQNLAQEKFEISGHYLPPGLRVSKQAVPGIKKINLALVKKTGTAEWYPKRRSSISDSIISDQFETENISSTGAGQERGFGLVEDQFLSGFKLKVLEHLQTGDFIISRVDLQDELHALGIDNRGFFYWNNGDLPINELRNRFQQELKEDYVSTRRRNLERMFSWRKISSEIVNILENKTGRKI